VSVEAESPEAAVRKFQKHLNRVLNTVLTRYRLEFWKGPGNFFYLSFLANDEPVAVRLDRRPWHLFLSQTLEAVGLKSDKIELKTVAYAYRIQSSPRIDVEPFVRFEYVGSRRDADFAYSRNHVQFHRDYHSIVTPFSPSKFHTPTGWVTIESIIRFAITDLKVPPRVSNWRQILNDGERLFRDWSSRAGQ
jgi:hypothetical protein